MNPRQCGVVVALLMVAGTAVPAVATAATADTLFVDNTVQCSDSGTGTADLPFCTVQAAADVVNPGQTVEITGEHDESTTITRPGTQASPIVFEAAQPDNQQPGSLIGPTVVQGVHDVVLRNLDFGQTIGSTPDTLDIAGSARIELDGDRIGGAAGGTLHVTGDSTAITVSRSTFNGGAAGADVRIDAGGSGDTITGNNFNPGSGGIGDIDVDGTPGTAITGNTVLGACQQGIAVTGAAAGTTIENNIVNAVPGNPFGCPDASATEGVLVDPAAAPSVTDDYNIVYTTSAGDTLYNWAGTQYPSQAAFTSATGQGVHDLDVDPQVDEFGVPIPPEGSPAIDSGNADAPGVTDTDIIGEIRLDDPLVPNTGAGHETFVDRGAYEAEDNPGAETAGVSVGQSAAGAVTQAPAGTPLTVSASFDDSWHEPLTCDIDFGDGQTATALSPCTTQHTYTSTGTHTVTISAGNAANIHNTFTSSLTIVPAGGTLTPRLTTTPLGGTGVTATISGGSDPWNLTTTTIDYGDGSAPVSIISTSNVHRYAKAGTYTIKATTNDVTGATASTSTTITTAGSDYTAVGPIRLLDTRSGVGGATTVAARGTVRLKIAGVGAIPAHVTAVAMNVTVTGPKIAGTVTAYPDGIAEPGVSNLNFVAGQTIANMSITQVGSDGFVDLTNNTAGALNLVADVTGYFTTTAASGYTGGLPARLLDTRNGTGTGGAKGMVAAGSATKIQITGITTPFNAPIPATGVAAVVLNVTVTGPTQSGFVTAYPDGTTRPVASNVNYAAGQTIANTVIAPVGADGAVALYTESPTNLVADIEGYFGTQARNAYVPLTPVRIVDTRSGVGGPKAPLSPRTSQFYSVVREIPPPNDSNAIDVVLNVTVTNTRQAGALTVYAPTGAPPPTTSNVNWAAGQTVPNLTIAPLENGVNGVADEGFFNDSAGTTDLVVDASGYFG